MKRIFTNAQGLMNFNQSRVLVSFEAKSLLFRPIYFRSDRFRKKLQIKNQNQRESTKQDSDAKQTKQNQKTFLQRSNPAPKAKKTHNFRLSQQIKKGIWPQQTILLYLKYFHKNQISKMKYYKQLHKKYQFIRSVNVMIRQNQKLESQQKIFRKHYLTFFLISFIILELQILFILALSKQYMEIYNISGFDELMNENDINEIVEQLQEINFQKHQLQELGQFINFQIVRLTFKENLFQGQQSKNITKKILQKLGFKDEKITVYLKTNCFSSNLILAGLQKIQIKKDPSNWVKLKKRSYKQTFFQAMVDTLLIAFPFLIIRLRIWRFNLNNIDKMVSGFKSTKVKSMKNINVRFKDVAGMENAKQEITEFVEFLKKSDKYVQMGVNIPKGALLTGPPGTGKTMLAKACAGQAGTSFFYVSGSEFVQMFVGLGSSRVRTLFEQARKQAPSIIFIDEIDAIGKKRQNSRNEEKDSTLNQLLVEMDGFSTSETVIVLAATNRKDTLDSALTRSGRFDRMIEVCLPQIQARKDIFMVYLAPLKINPNRPLSQIAKRLSQLTPGFSGADIANLCNQAAIIATRKQRTYIQDEDFEDASERIMVGYVKKGLSNAKTRKRVAYHQAGHAVCGWYLRGGDPLVKLTVIPRSKGALGYAQYLPKSAYINTKDELIDKVSIMLGGTTSEQVFLGNMSSGNADDLQKVYSLTRKMVTQFGMGKTTYNMTLDEQTYIKKESQKLRNVMDNEILQIVREASDRARNIIQSKRDIVENLAQELLAKQTLNSADIIRIMGEKPAFD